MEQTHSLVQPELTRNTKRVVTRRGVLWLGQTCNIRCHFCYFLDRIKSASHPEHPFMTLEKAKFICDTLRNHYGNSAIDIQGGEPLLFKEIYDLVRHCREIGLYPTLITNGILLSKKETCQKLKEAGVRDLLVSVHALDEVYDSIVGTPGASQKQAQGIQNCIDVGIPFRFNVVLSKWALAQYVHIAELAVRSGARVVNFIAFNPFEDQATGKRTLENVATYSEVATEVNKALDVLEAAEVEANVRYIPICMVDGRHRKSMYNFQQLSYDLHEWDYASWSWTEQPEQRMRDGDCSDLISLEDATYVHGRPIESLLDGDRLWLSSCFMAGKRFVHDKLAPYPKARMAIRKLYHRTLDSPIVKGRLQNPRKAESPEQIHELYRANARLRAEAYCGYQYSSKCRECAARLICDGFHGDYVSIFGAEEAKPVRDLDPIDDPCYFIAEQAKVIEKEECEWVLGAEAGSDC